MSSAVVFHTLWCTWCQKGYFLYIIFLLSVMWVVTSTGSRKKYKIVSHFQMLFLVFYAYSNILMHQIKEKNWQISRLQRQWIAAPPFLLVGFQCALPHVKSLCRKMDATYRWEANCLNTTQLLHLNCALASAWLPSVPEVPRRSFTLKDGHAEPRTRSVL